MRRTAVLAFCAVVGGLSCDLTGPQDFPHAVATFMCGPADGPATAILLARDPIQSLDPSYPFVSVDIWHAVSELGGTTWSVNDGSGNVSARYFTGPGKFVSATAGSVLIDRVGTDNRVEGSVLLRFPSRSVDDDFSAPWMESLVLCG
jgi:hypothetical protein